MFRFALLFLLSASAVHAGTFAGAASCAGCHAPQHQLWQGSHHDLAMQEPAAGTVLGNFNGASFTRRGVTTTFRRDGERFIVRTAGEDGTLQDFTVRYVFGVYPLQQYLLPLSRGRLQAFDVAWDSRPAGEGGQRWFHLNPEEVTDHTDPLHWTGPYMNWNLSCAECHSTDVQKRYDPVTRSYDTLFAEIDVACESCHGPGEQHIRLAAKGQLGAGRDTGLETTLAQRGEWAFTGEESIARRRQEPAGNAQIDNCGRCHARRGTLGDYHFGKALLDSHRLALPEPPLYYHDGQIRDEVYVYGSFVQSKMHQAGVVCSNCHEPHSLQLRAEGNGVCAQCHKADIYDRPEHHHHTPDSAGAECANCHMPETTYMTVDPRRDHSMRIPRPDLSITTGVPNACNQCHDGQDADWALAAIRDWGIEFEDTASHPARALQQLAAGNRQALPRLEQLAHDNSAAPIMRATALEALGRAGAPGLPGYAAAQLESAEPLLRVSAVRSLDGLPLGQRYQLLKGLVADEITSVRMAVAEALAGVPLDQISPAQAEELRSLFGEYTRIQRQHADMPGVQLQLGIFLANRGDLPAAEKAYREALYLNPQLLPARLNLADLLRALQREDEARAEIMAALGVAPDSGAALHAMGLLETRSGNREQALAYLRRAAELEQEGVRHRYVYAIALHDSGQPQQAVTRLEALQRSMPGNEEVLLALVNYSAELGNRDKAVRYARELAEAAPENTRYRQLYRRLANTVEQ